MKNRTLTLKEAQLHIDLKPSQVLENMQRANSIEMVKDAYAVYREIIIKRNAYLNKTLSIRADFLLDNYSLREIEDIVAVTKTMIQGITHSDHIGKVSPILEELMSIVINGDFIINTIKEKEKITFGTENKDNVNIDQVDLFYNK